MRGAQLVNQKKFFQLAKIIARADRKSPLVQGVMDDNEVELNPQQLLEQHISRLYCEYNPPHRGAVCHALLSREREINRIAGPFQINLVEMRQALKRLAKNKALGIDGLPDNTLHAIAKLTTEKEGFAGTEFLMERVNEVFARTVWPSYLGTAKFVPLSKTDSEYPAPNDVRTMAVLPAISKLLEICILGRLEAVVYRDTRIIDDAQSGFRPGSGTEVHLVRVLGAIERITRSLNHEDDLAGRHEGYHLVFLDLKKAYDNVDRDLLLTRMLNAEIPT